MSISKFMIILLIAELIKKISLYKMSYFTEAFSYFLNEIRVELKLANYATKYGLK